MIRFPLFVLVGITVLVMAACGGGQAPAPIPTTPPPVPPTLTHVISVNDHAGRGPFTFNPSDLTFSVGETVTLELRSESQFHTLALEELGIDQSIDGGEAVSFAFAFDRPGTYKLICIPHQDLGVMGTITVR